MNHTDFKSFIRANVDRFAGNEQGLALVEAALLLPVLITLMFGIYDLGSALMLNQKVVAATQIAGDLIGRERSVDTDELDQAFTAARLALDPYDNTQLGVDIVGVQFDENDVPQECWRYTTAGITPNTVSIDDTEGLGQSGEGIVIVTARYRYEPFFTSAVLGAFDVVETAFIRGRRAPFIPREGVLC